MSFISSTTDHLSPPPPFPTKHPRDDRAREKKIDENENKRRKRAVSPKTKDANRSRRSSDIATYQPRWSEHDMTAEQLTGTLNDTAKQKMKHEKESRPRNLVSCKSSEMTSGPRSSPRMKKKMWKASFCFFEKTPKDGGTKSLMPENKTARKPDWMGENTDVSPFIGGPESRLLRARGVTKSKNDRSGHSIFL